ncbi:MAG: amidase [Solirubrobacterales bacterium]
MAAAQAPGGVGRPASEIARLVAAGELLAAEAVDAHIERIEATHDRLNAVSFRRFEQARTEAAEIDRLRTEGEALGPLAGVPITIKDQARMADTPTSLGMSSREGHRAEGDGPLVRRLRGAGAIVLGKTNVSQMLFYWEADNPLHGRTDNPWAADRTPGGSSGGEAAIIAAGGSALGLGADYGGSLRIPAHFCGISTIKPTANRLTNRDNVEALLPNHPVIPQQFGPMARTVADVALGMEVLVDVDDPDPQAPPVPWPDHREVDPRSLRVGVVTGTGPVDATRGVLAGVRRAADALAAAGAEVVEWSLPGIDRSLALFSSLVSADGGAMLRAELAAEPQVDPRVKRTAQVSRMPAALGKPAVWLARALGQESAAAALVGGRRSVAKMSALVDEREKWLAAMDEQMRADGIDVILTPPFVLPAIPHNTFSELFPAAGITLAFNVLGMPAGIVPTGLHGDTTLPDPGFDVIARAAAKAARGSEGVPTGVQVVARWWREDIVLAAMEAIERELTANGPLPLAPPV